MARRPHNLHSDDPLPASIQRHMRTIGVQNINSYFAWCWNNGFPTTLEKSRGDLQEEVDAFRAVEERRKQHSRLHKNPRAFLESVCCGELSADEIDRPNYKRVAAEVEASNESEEARASLLEMLLSLAKLKDLVFGAMTDRDETPFIRGLVKLHDRKALWLRDLASWKPKSKNAERQFGELTHHLFDKFGDVPVFMEKAWLRNDRPSWRYRDWYVHLGRGYNFSTAKCPILVTKRIAHEFLRAPDDYTIEQALRYGQLKAFAASRNTIDALVATRLGRSFVNEEFWITVLRFVAENPMLDPRQIGPLVDYLQNQKFEPTEIEIAPGEWRREPPPQPGLSMRGRTVENLLRQIEIWHRNMGRLYGLPGGNYAKAQFDGFTVQKSRGTNSVHWVIRQLRSAKDLQLESEELKHCVASYHSSCARGDCTIWSLSRSEDGSSYQRRQTIEVDKGGTIVQCRGLANRDPTNEEWSIVNDWARDTQLQISTYL